MRVTVAVRGRFHAFQLARELDRHGALARLITSYPKRIVARFGIPREKLVSRPGTELAIRATARLPARWLEGIDLHAWASERFDAQAARLLGSHEDVFVGWSSMALQSIRRARELGLATVLQRGSSHIAYQSDLLREEYARFGVRPEVASDRTIDTELREYQLADAIDVPSEFARRSFVERGVPASRVLVNPYGVDLGAFQPGPRGDDVFRVLHCGALSLRKGVHYLLQAFHELALPQAELWLVGGVRDEILPFLKRYGGPGVVVPGPRPESRLPEIYRRASVFCLASVEDGFGLVILQAMASGLPVICSTHTGGPDVVREGRHGFLVPIRDVGALKDRILYLYENPGSREAMGSAARERVRDGHGWEDYGRRAVAAYAEIRSCHATSSISVP